MRSTNRSAFRDGGSVADRDLVVAFKGGDAHAYALIYREYRPLAESVCQRILGNPEDAAEAAQETMLKVFQGLPRFNGRYLLRAWVARIATNVCLDAIRKRQRRVNEFDSPDAESLEVPEHAVLRSSVDDPAEIAAREDEGRRIRELLKDLPGHHREALVMREFDGRSHEEIAATLGMSAPQVKALIHRAKKGFRKAWEVQSGRASVFVWPAVLAAPVRWLKRVLSPARDVAESAATPVIQLAAHPAVAQATV
ncbi:MAG: RNA polymerase sigma factor, partial [bacterium]